MDILLMLVTIALLLGSIPSIRQAYVKRDSLAGYNFFGSIAFFVAQVLYVAYLAGTDLLTMFLAFPLVIYWGVVVCYKVKEKKRERKIPTRTIGGIKYKVIEIPKDVEERLKELNDDYITSYGDPNK